MPEQLTVFVFGMAHGKLSEEGNPFAAGGSGEQNHGNGAVHIRFARNDVPHICQHRIGGTGHSAHRQLHGGPALGRNGGDPQLIKEIAAQQHKRIHFFQQRRGQIIHLIAGGKQFRSLFQFRIPFGKNAFVLIHHHTDVDGNATDAETLHQFPFVEDDRTEGARSQTDLRDFQIAEALDHARNRREFFKPARKFRGIHAAGTDVRERNVIPLQKAGYPENAALRIGVAHPVRIKTVIERSVDADRLADFGNLGNGFFVAEISMDDKHGIDLFGKKALGNLHGVRLIDHHVNGVNPLNADKRNAVSLKMFAQILHRGTTALLGNLPVENTGAWRYIPAAGNETDLQTVIQHRKIPFFWNTHFFDCTYCNSKSGMLQWMC